MSLRPTWLPVALLCFILGCASGPAPDVASSQGVLTQSPQQGLQPVLEDSDIIPIIGSPTLGPVSAPVTIVAFSDLQCPYCQRGAITMAELLNKYPQEVKVVFKHYPLSFHAQAGPGALAAVAAGNQGKFWQMHDWLFANQRQMSQHSDDFEDWAAQYAAKLELDVAQFRADYNAGQTAALVEHDMALGAKLGVRGTPAFFVNGERVVGAQPLEVFVKLIESQLARADVLRTSGEANDTNLYAKLVAENYEPEQKARLPSFKDAPDKGDEQPEPQVDTSALTINPTQVQGPGDAKVTIFVFADFQCPFCQRGDKNLRAALDQVDEPVRVVYKHLPLPFHRAAGPAALASMAAGAQGKFWQMHDLLFERQKQLPNDDDLSFYTELAGELQLDTEKFEQDMHREDFIAEINQDIRQAEVVGARGTPNYLINGIRVTGAQPTEVFVDTIREALQQKQ